MTFQYRAEILDQLAGHGVRPGASTRPALVFEYLNDLYRYELRVLRARLRGRAFPPQEYSGRVIELRRKYPLVSVHPKYWTVPGTPVESDDVALC